MGQANLPVWFVSRSVGLGLMFLDNKQTQPQHTWLVCELNFWSIIQIIHP